MGGSPIWHRPMAQREEPHNDARRPPVSTRHIGCAPAAYAIPVGWSKIVFSLTISSVVGRFSGFWKR